MKYSIPWLPVCVVMAGCGSTVSVPGMTSHPSDVFLISNEQIEIRLMAAQSTPQPMWELFSKQVAEHPDCPRIRIEWRQLGYANRLRLDYDQSTSTMIFEDGRGDTQTHRGVTRSDASTVQAFLMSHAPKIFARESSGSTHEPPS